MAYKLIGEDCALSIHIGPFCDFSINPAAAPAAGDDNIIGICKRIGIKSSLEKLNVKAMGDFPKRNRYHSADATCEIEEFVPSTGFDVPESALGHYITVTHKPLSTAASAINFTGVITGWDYDAATATEQSVKIAIDMNPDYLATGG